MNWFPLRCHDHYSLQSAIATPEQIAERCVELGLPGCAITNLGNISSAVTFIKEMNGGKDKKRPKLKAILGCEFYLCKQPANIKTIENKPLTNIIILAKSLKGYKNLCKLVTLSNKEDHIDIKPRLHILDFLNNSEDLIAISSDVEVLPTCKKIFKDVYVGVCGIDEAYPGQVEDLRKAASDNGLSCVALANPYYCRPEDAIDQRVVLCVGLDSTLKKIQDQLERKDEHGVLKFFKSQNFHIPSPDEMARFHTPQELVNSCIIADKCEAYTILRSPQLPKFKCPNGLTEDEYLRQLTIEGWKNKIVTTIPESQHKIYGARVKEELAIIKECGFSGYLLIVYGIINEFRKRGNLIGSGRGSIGGSLVAYLIGLHGMDPIKLDLSFARFYNKGRNTKDHVSLPDVDTDFPKFIREQVIEFLKETYGEDCVSHISTYGSTKGRGAISDVLRMHEACTFAEIKEITSHIPDPAKIADQIQELEDEGSEDTTTIDWTLDNKGEKLKDWCYRDEKGKLQGRFAKLFEQAIRLEGVKRNRGRHAAGIIISPEPLEDVCPMVWDADRKELVCAYEFNELEAIGLVKMDILGIALLDKLMGVNKILAGKDLNDE